MNLKQHIKTFIVLSRRQGVSDVKLKDLVLKSNKEIIIKTVLEFMSKRNIGRWNQNDLDSTYNQIISLSKIEYANEECNNYEIRQGFDMFMGMFDIDKNIECTGLLIRDMSTYKDELPIEFILNCRISTKYLKASPVQIVSDCLLQTVYINELSQMAYNYQKINKKQT